MSRIDARLARLERQITVELSGKEQVALWQDAIYGSDVERERFERLHRQGRINKLIWNLFQLEQQGPCTGHCDRCDPELCPLPENQRISDASRKEHQ